MTLQFPRRQKQPDGSYLRVEPPFWLIDDGRPVAALFRDGRRFASEAEARAAMGPTDGVIQVTPRKGGQADG
jgi:hypothetical protein